MEGEVQAPTGEGSGPAQVQDGARITVEQLRRFASNAGITLYPWQEGITLAVLNGEPVEWPRRSGRTAMRRYLDLITEQREAELKPRTGFPLEDG
jgi:hypothetical protein